MVGQLCMDIISTGLSESNHSSISIHWSLCRHPCYCCSQVFTEPFFSVVGGAVASWLLHSSWSERSRSEPRPGTWCCVWQDIYSYSASLHPGVLMGTGELMGKPNKLQGGVTCNGLASRPGGVEILLVRSSGTCSGS